jgi:hypothetical protein
MNYFAVDVLRETRNQGPISTFPVIIIENYWQQSGFSSASFRE